MNYTEEIRAKLPGVIERFSIVKILDAPCGDFNWMKDVVQGRSLQYVGGDIVPALISSLKRDYEGPNIEFITLDLTSDPLPPSDLLFCRDLLFHLSFDDARKVLDNFLLADIPYILTTSHDLKGIRQNFDIVSGDFRMLDLTLPPFNFPSKALEVILDFKAPDPPRYMKLWSKEDVVCSLRTFQDKLS